ncbi:MAG TPA: PQQ-binding-like beta-propeller repeat protein [Pirellulaceae bacterium]|jgi:outer membrane protein assembly factor BamB|nr:PQQ-binding-like beta-propeller repeat protein [Pirellulaceae bacterium]
MSRSVAVRTGCLIVALLGLLTASAVAENWPQWRGAKLDGVSHEKNLPVKWSQTENIAWRLALPGQAGSTPVVWGDRIFLTSADGADLILMCVGTDGKQQWRQKLSTGDHTVRGDEGNVASNSPSTDGKHVWAMLADGTLGCYTVDGKEIWKFDLEDRYGKFKIQFGLTSTPVLDNGRLFLQMIHGDYNAATSEALVICLDAATGKQIWKSDRVTGADNENEHSYASPILYRDAQREFLLTHGADYAIAYDLKDGREIFRCGDLNPKGTYHPTLRFVASPAAADGFIVLPTAKHQVVFCIKPDGTGDITDKEQHFHWRRLRDTTDVPSPLVVDGLVYMCRENGNLVCLDASTGEEYYDQRTTVDRHRASPVYADGKVYTAARNGKVSVIKAGKKFELLSVNDMTETITSSPVISGGRIYLRTFDALYAVGK